MDDATAALDIDSEFRLLTSLFDRLPHATIFSVGHRLGLQELHSRLLTLQRRPTSIDPILVLADIQLANGSSGLDVVKEILTTIDVPVIFITAYPARLLTGERPTWWPNHFPQNH